MSEEARLAEQRIDKRAEWIKKHIDVVYGSPIGNLMTPEREPTRRDYRGEKLHFKEAEPKVRFRA